MFNVSFDPITGDKVYIFHQHILKNIQYATIALDHILQRVYDKNEIREYSSPHIYYFSNMEAVLNACSGICNVLNYCNNRNKVAYYRSKLLREYYKITIGNFPIILNKSIRNTNEHFDERIDLLHGETGDCNIIDENTPEDIKKIILEQMHLRTLDLKAMEYITYVLRAGYTSLPYNEERLEKAVIDLKNLREEFVKLKGQIYRMRDERIKEKRSCNWLDENLNEILTENQTTRVPRNIL